jgi:hypothetical protein
MTLTAPLPERPYKDLVGKLTRRLSARLSLIEAQYNFDLGDEYEVALCEVLSDMLPARYGVCRGTVVTVDGEEAGDDLIIYDRLSYPTLRSSLGQNFAIKEQVPIEAAYAYIECKHSVELADTLKQSQTLAVAVEQVRTVKALASKRQPNPNHHYKDQDRFKRRKSADFPAPFPELKNELFGMVFARKFKLAKPTSSPSNIEIGKEHGPDLLIVGEDLLFTPSVVLGPDGIRSSLFFSSSFQSTLRLEKAPGSAIGLGLLTLLHVINWMELLPIDYATVLNGAFADVLWSGDPS